MSDVLYQTLQVRGGAAGFIRISDGGIHGKRDNTDDFGVGYWAWIPKTGDTISDWQARSIISYKDNPRLFFFIPLH